MSGKWKKLIYSLTVVILLIPAVVVLGCSKSSTTTSSASAGPVEHVIKIGLFASFTGPIAETSEPNSRSQMLAFQYVTDNGGVKFRNPKTGKDEILKFDVTAQDTGFAVPPALAAYQQMKDSIDVFTATSTGQHEALAPAMIQDKKLYIASTWSATLVNFMPRRLVGGYMPYQDMFGEMIDYIAKTKPGAKIAIIAADAAYGHTLEEQPVKDYVKSKGIVWTGIEFLSGTASDTTVQLNRIHDQHPDYIIMQVATGQTALILKNADTMGILKDQQWVAGLVNGFPRDIVNLVGDRAKGLIGLTPYVLDTMVDNKAMQIIASYTKQKLGRDWRSGFLMGWTLTDMPAVEGFRIAAEKYGWPLTTDQMTYGMLNIKNYNWNGLFAGPVNTSPSSPFFATSNYLYKIDDSLYPVLIDTITSGPHIAQVPVSAKQLWEP